MVNLAEEMVGVAPDELKRALRPLEGKVALVTGASRGIGRAIAVELASAGAQVALNNTSGESRARPVMDEIEALGSTSMHVHADVAQSQEARAMVKQVVEKWGRLDILVNNAGITRDKTLRKLTDEEWLAVINTNLNGVFFCTSAAIPIMVEQKYGRIVNISSMTAQTGNFGQANYAAAKAGIHGLTKTAALELARYNITVNIVCPGYTATDMTAKIPSDIQEQIKTKIPAARFAKPEEIAQAVRYLVTAGDYVTGQQIHVNGGAYMI
jgi:acetoacetyl-CoA reductase/3-oxoacyl-[acyl-carrier protein] reductase